MQHPSTEHGVEWDRFIVLGGERIPLRTPSQVATDVEPTDGPGGLIRLPAKVARWAWKFLVGQNLGAKYRRELSMTVDPQFRHLVLEADAGWLNEFYATWTGYQQAWYSAIAMSAQMSVLRKAVDDDIVKRAGQMRDAASPAKAPASRAATGGKTQLVPGAGIPDDLAAIASFDSDRKAHTA